MATKGREPSPARPLDRRTLLSGSAAALGSLALAGCGESARPPQVSSLAPDLAILDRPIVDVHAHIFVASDLPGHQFIVQSKGDPDHVDTLMSFVEISRPGARRIAMRG